MMSPAAVGTITILFGSLAVVFLISLALRELACWYWKINERLKVEQGILQGLRVIHQDLQAMTPKIEEPPEPETSDE